MAANFNEDQIQFFRSVFTDFDKTNDGRISIEELHEVLDSVEVKYNDEQLKSLV